MGDIPLNSSRTGVRLVFSPIFQGFPAHGRSRGLRMRMLVPTKGNTRLIQWSIRIDPSIAFVQHALK